MNHTNKDTFSFDTDSSVLLVGQTASGKTALVKELINKLVAKYAPEECKIALFDLKMVEFTRPIIDYNPDYLYFNVINDPSVGLNKLEELAQQAESRANADAKQHLLFVYIEECDMAFIDQKRFDNALISINKNASDANIKLIYATSRISAQTVSQDLLSSFDIILSGRLASEDDAKYLGIAYQDNQEPYSFLLKRRNNNNPVTRPVATHANDSNIKDKPPRDDRFIELFSKVSKGEISRKTATVPIASIVPFSNYKPIISCDYRNYFLKAFLNDNPPELLVYEKDGKYIMSDDYTAYYMYLDVKAKNVVCAIICKPSS